MSILTIWYIWIYLLPLFTRFHQTGENLGSNSHFRKIRATHFYSVYLFNDRLFEIGALFSKSDLEESPTPWPFLVESKYLETFRGTVSEKLSHSRLYVVSILLISLFLKFKVSNSKSPNVILYHKLFNNLRSNSIPSTRLF